MKNRISEYLKQRKLAQRQLAEMVGCTEVSMARYARGDRAPKASMAKKIAEALGADVDDMFPEGIDD